MISIHEAAFFSRHDRFRLEIAPTGYDRNNRVSLMGCGLLSWGSRHYGRILHFFRSARAHHTDLS